MAIKPSTSGGSIGDKAAAPAAAPRPGRQAARAAAASYSFAESDEDEGDDAASSDRDCSSDPDEVMSPAPELLKAKAKPRTGAAAAGKSKAAAAAAVLPPKPLSPAPRVAFGRTMSSSESPLVEKKAAPKRKPRGECWLPAAACDSQGSCLRVACLVCAAGQPVLQARRLCRAAIVLTAALARKPRDECVPNASSCVSLLAAYKVLCIVCTHCVVCTRNRLPALNIPYTPPVC
jgi:hypothetical protein